MSSFWHIVDFQGTAAILMNVAYPSLFSQGRGWMKMISFIKSFCKYRRFVSDPRKRQEFEEYLHLELQNNKESKLVLYLLSFLLTFQIQGLAQVRSCRAVALRHACVNLGSSKSSRSWVQSQAQACLERM